MSRSAASCIERLGLLAALEDPQVVLQAVHQVEPEQRVDGGADDPGGVLAFGEFLDLLAVEEEEVGDADRQVGLDGFVPVLGQQLVGLAVPADAEGLLDALGALTPGALQLDSGSPGPRPCGGTRW